MRVVLFGVGNTGRKFLDHDFDKENDQIVASVDNNSELWGEYLNEFGMITSPKRINEYEFDYIVITSVYRKEIEAQLKAYCDYNRILHMEEYARMVYSRRRYQNRYSKKNKSNLSFLNGRVVVYTAITGNYDVLNEPQEIDSGVDYICYTNNRGIRSEKWRIKYIDDNSLSNMYLAKRIKVLPHEYLKEYDTSIWIDGKFQITGNIVDYINRYQKDKPILCFPHFARNCIFEEAAQCIVDGIGVKKDIVHQISHYERENYPYDFGLYEMGCIVRKHNDELVKKIMQDWWGEILHYSYRDQISFPYVCWRNDFTPDICDKYLYRNRWLSCRRDYSKALGKL